MPAGYYSSPSNVVVSGTDIKRPKGMVLEEGKMIHGET